MSFPKDDFVLDDDDEDTSANLQAPHDYFSSMVSSPTTDTLDSVALEPAAFEDIAKVKINTLELDIKPAVCFNMCPKSETDDPTAKKIDLQLADMDEAEIVEMIQEPETPRFMSQVSCSSDHSATEPSSLPSVPPTQQQQQQQNLQAESVAESSKIQGPVVGTTPQMSPMGTPVHHPTPDRSELSNEEKTATAAETTGANTVQASTTKARFDSQSSLPTSPFHQMNPEVKTGSSVFGPFGDSGPVDDAFSSILSMSDADRRHDAWIPSDATSHILKAMVSGGHSSFVPAVEQLSTPGILSNEPQGDPVRDLVLRYMGEQEASRRSVLTVDSVTQDADGLKKLMDAGCLRAAIDLTSRLLEQVGQGYGKAGQVTVHTPHSLQLWFCRLSLMVKLRMHDAAEAEMRAFQTLDTPDLYFQFYANTYPGRRGSMVSFAMRLLHAELPLLCGRSQETLDRLYYMLAVCTRIKSNLTSDLSEDGSSLHMTFEARKASVELWRKREVDIIYKIGSTMLSVKDYEGALVIYNSLLEKDKNSYLELLAGIGRINLQ
ncbi:trafficking protein particle complex subunit 12-like, partial [Elysia marginata]